MSCWHGLTQGVSRFLWATWGLWPPAGEVICWYAAAFDRQGAPRCGRAARGTRGRHRCRRPVMATAFDSHDTLSSTTTTNHAAQASCQRTVRPTLLTGRPRCVISANRRAAWRLTATPFADVNTLATEHADR